MDMNNVEYIPFCAACVCRSAIGALRKVSIQNQTNIEYLLWDILFPQISVWVSFNTHIFLRRLISLIGYRALTLT